MKRKQLSLAIGLTLSLVALQATAQDAPAAEAAAPARSSAAAPGQRTAAAAQSGERSRQAIGVLHQKGIDALNVAVPVQSGRRLIRSASRSLRKALSS